MFFDIIKPMKTRTHSLRFNIKTPSNVVKLAEELARRAHGEIDHRRKFTEEPYIIHPQEVAQRVREDGGSLEAVAAAWLHDTVEDTNLTIEEIELVCGSRVASLVWHLTDHALAAAGNRATRQKINNEHLARGDREVHLIKRADILNNLESLVQHDPKFARVWIEEKLVQSAFLLHLDPREAGVLIGLLAFRRKNLIT